MIIRLAKTAELSSYRSELKAQRPPAFLLNNRDLAEPVKRSVIGSFRATHATKSSHRSLVVKISHRFRLKIGLFVYLATNDKARLRIDGPYLAES